MQAAHSALPLSASLSDSYRRVRARTEELCEPLEVEDYIPQPTVDVSPPKWNIAHTTWFFEEMILKKFLGGYRVFDSDFAFLFNSYYNTVGDRTLRDHRGDLSRPTVKRVFEYRRYVDGEMAKLLADESLFSEPGSELEELVVLGLNHEQQHQELFLTDLKYTFSVNPLFPVYRENYVPEEASEPPASGDGRFITLEGGIVEIGHTGGGFCFDNELARHKVYLDDHSIATRLVTNAEFLEFVNDGGYRDHRLWHSEGWDWVNREGVASPLYWYDRDGEWLHFTLGGLRMLPMEAPVCHVSLYEASAFAEWKGMRLPTEFEWEAANERFDWGKRWEWTNSAYLPYPGFRKPEGAVGEYNGKFMMNQMVLRGASVVTPEGHSRPTYRNFFHPHLRWQFTGIRLAK
ncbi:MAG TPA: ergothioneine biosynthesis protein EgtB [Pyrinomonadaceae bacterium]|nr:ergothioneine biosynthesis protein EgtB [Pyrinomonadaceae bacterium]HMP65276.1 ergothioneine biosynthesis protein EgtB [Pyrinomonadaceae bacterium]